MAVPTRIDCVETLRRVIGGEGDSPDTGDDSLLLESMEELRARVRRCRNLGRQLGRPFVSLDVSLATHVSARVRDLESSHGRS